MEAKEDDWFYESIFRYKNLSMFELEYPVSQVEPTSDNSICVSCSNSKRHQLLELLLPLRLLSQSSETSETLVTSDSDLKIKCGTFTDSNIYQIKAFDVRKVAASHLNTKGIILYNLSSDDSDEIKKECLLNCELESPLITIDGSRMAMTKKRGSPRLLYDINTWKLMEKCVIDESATTLECDELVTPIFMDLNTVAHCCQSTGEIMIFDTRLHRLTRLSTNENKLDTWSFTSLYECSGKSSNQPFYLAKVSKSGILEIYDARNFNTPAYVNTNLGIKCSKSGSLQVKFKPDKRDCISVSGFDSNVYVYQLGPELQPKLSFTHDGHKHVEGYSSKTLTTDHMWAKKLNNLLISSADNGTVQLWQFRN